MTTQRVRTSSFLWARFKHLDSPFGYVGVRERPNTELMKMLVDMYPDDEDVRRFGDRITEKRAHVLRGEGEQYQEYSQKDMKSFAPDGYSGTTKIGRAYTNSLLPYLPSRLLNTIYKETHMQLDVRSCFSAMLAAAFGDLELEVVGKYANDPQSVYDHFQLTMGVGKRAVKKLVYSIACSWPCVGEDPEVGNWGELSRDPFVVSLKRDVAKMAAAVREWYPHFFEMVQAKCAAEGKGDHVDGTALFYLASDMEHSVVREVFNYLFPGRTELPDVVWKYDGFLFPKEVISGQPYDRFVAGIKRHVMERLGIRVDFNLSDLHGDSLGICLAPGERGEEDAYLRWKARFERHFAHLRNPPVFMMFSRGGKCWVDLKKTEFEHVTLGEDTEMLKRWLADPEKRSYKGRDFVPPPMVIEEGYMNTYQGIAAAQLPAVENVDIGLYLRHVNILVGNLNGEHPDYAKYLHDLIAYKLQHPGRKWRVMVIIISAQGVGKDIWFDFLASIVGKEQCVKDDGIHKFADKNSHQLEGKLLCCLQEMGYKDVKDHEETLKTIITNSTIKIERKFVNTFFVSNVVDIIGFTNQPNAINVTSDDRRYFVVTADSTFMQKKEYIMPLLAFFEDDRNKRAVYDWYMSRELGDFDPSADRPITESHLEMAENSVSHMDRFLSKSLDKWMDQWRSQADGDFCLQDGRLRIPSAIFIDDWMDYAKAVGMDKADKRASMIQFMSKQVRELNMRTDGFKSEFVAHIVKQVRSGKRGRGYELDVRGLRRYFAKIFNEEEGESEVPRGTRRAEWNPGRGPRYQVRENGAVIFQSDDLEEINKTLGEAYVEDVRDIVTGQVFQVLVHQRIGKEIDIGTEYMGEGGKLRLEMKYPFYVYDRTA